MTHDELLEALRKLEISLRSAKTQDFFMGQSQDIRNRFVSFRQEITVLVGRLTNAQLARIADKLAELSDDLNTGINDLQGKISVLNDAVAFLNTLGTVVGLAARIVLLAA